jgi:small conductance mechanosensitive channel
MPVLNKIDIQQLIDMAVQGVASYTPKIFGAILALYIGFKVANIIGKTVEKYFSKADFDPTVERFIVNILRVALKVMVLVAVVGIL